MIAGPQDALPDRSPVNRFLYIGNYSGVGTRRKPECMKKFSLDATDIRILSAVQEHGKLSKTRLAEIVNLSPTPCWTRLNRLEAAGFIRGYRADIALDRIGDFTRVIVTISLTNHRKRDFDRFESRVRELDEVVECFATGGGMDYVMKVVSSGLPAFQDLMEDLLSTELGIERYMTYIVTRDIKSAAPNIVSLAEKSAKRN